MLILLSPPCSEPFFLISEPTESNAFPRAYLSFLIILEKINIRSKLCPYILEIALLLLAPKPNNLLENLPVFFPLDYLFSDSSFLS